MFSGHQCHPPPNPSWGSWEESWGRPTLEQNQPRAYQGAPKREGGLFAAKKQVLLCPQNWAENGPCSGPGYPPVAEAASVPLSFTSIFTFCSA